MSKKILNEHVIQQLKESISNNENDLNAVLQNMQETNRVIDDTFGNISKILTEIQLLKTGTNAHESNNRNVSPSGQNENRNNE